MEKILIDGNSVGYSNHCGAKLTVGTFQTQAIFGFIKSMRALRLENPDCSDLVLWDGVAQWRYDLYPGYKADRDKDPTQALMRENYKKARPFIYKALDYLGVRQLTVTSAEADDMAGLLSKSLSVNNKVTLVSGDKDWLGLVNENCGWFDPIRNTKVSHRNFYEFTGYPTGKAFYEGKALMGDTSDKINGVGGIGEKSAPVFLAQFGSVAEFLRQVDSGEYVPKKKVEQNFALNTGEPTDGRAIFTRNHKLMNLLDVPKPAPEDVQYSKPMYDKEKFRFICERMNFASILANFDNFVRPFSEGN